MASGLSNAASRRERHNVRSRVSTWTVSHLELEKTHVGRTKTSSQLCLAYTPPVADLYRPFSESAAIWIQSSGQRSQHSAAGRFKRIDTSSMGRSGSRIEPIYLCIISLPASYPSTAAPRLRRSTHRTVCAAISSCVQLTLTA